MGLSVPKRLQGQSASHARSRSQEAEAAKRVGGKVTKGSGSGAYEKGDIRLKGVIRIEAKTTKNKSFSVTREIIEKIEQATFGTGEVPAMLIEIEGGAKRCFIMPDWALDLVMGSLKG